MNGIPPLNRPEHNAHRAVSAKLVLVALFWGGTYVSGRALALEMPPAVAAAIRYALAAALLLAVAWKSEGGLPRLNASQSLLTFLLGATGVYAFSICFFGALSYMPASQTALFMALNPTVTTLLAAAFLRERLKIRQWAGIFIAFLGAGIVITRGEFAGSLQFLAGKSGWGAALMLGAVLSWSVYTVLGRRAMKTLTPVAATAYANFWGFALLAATALIAASPVDIRAFTWQMYLSLFYLGILGTVVSFVWYYEGVRSIGPSRAAVFINLVPIFGVALSAILLSEPVIPPMIAGGALTIAGVMLTNGRIIDSLLSASAIRRMRGQPQPVAQHPPSASPGT